MIKSFCLILTFIFVINCQGNPPTHAVCEIPSTYSALLDQVLIFPNFQTIEANLGEVYYSNPEQRIRFDIAGGISKYGSGTSTYIVSVWQDFANGVEYVLDRNTSVCTSYPMPYPLGPGQVPPNSEYGGSILAGSQPIHEYFFPMNFNGVEYYIEMGLMSGSCLPFNVDVFTVDNNGNPDKLVMAEAFFNVIPMVPPFILEIPEMCLQSSPSQIRDLPERIANIMDGLHLRNAALHSF